MIFQQNLAFASSRISYVNSIPENSNIIDVRDAKECEKKTLSTAICLPIEDVMASKQRLANFSGLLWKLGSAGLNGSEHVLIAGNRVTRKDAMAGILHLAGQRRISVLESAMSDLTAKNTHWSFSKGSMPSSTRMQVWQSPMRSEQIVLHNEMIQIVRGNDAFILDGRSDAEYWGQVVNARRGGHIPGADSSSYSHWLDSSEKTNIPTPRVLDIADQSTIVYAADTYTGISYYTRVIAAGLSARIYLDGWVRWAAQTDLPVDAASYSSPDVESTSISPSNAHNPLNQHFLRLPFSWPFWGLSVAIAFICGYIISKIRLRKN